jgi:hypothetical protein
VEDIYRITTTQRRNKTGFGLPVRIGSRHMAACTLRANPDAKIEVMTGEFTDVTDQFDVTQPSGTGWPA